MTASSLYLTISTPSNSVQSKSSVCATTTLTATVRSCIREDGKTVGGLILKIDEQTQRGKLEILFVSPDVHSKGIGSAAWREVERLYPETLVWETCTPYFEKRNIHFYINKLGFSAVEFFCEYHREEPENERFGPQDDESPKDDEGPDEMFRFVKYMKSPK